MVHKLHEALIFYQCLVFAEEKSIRRLPSAEQLAWEETSICLSTSKAPLRSSYLTNVSSQLNTYNIFKETNFHSLWRDWFGDLRGPVIFAKCANITAPLCRKPAWPEPGSWVSLFPSAFLPILGTWFTVSLSDERTRFLPSLLFLLLPVIGTNNFLTWKLFPYTSFSSSCLMIPTLKPQGPFL